MIEVMIERWIGVGGVTDHIWSVWRDGSRIEIGQRHETTEAAEVEAREYCRRHFGGDPDRVTVL